MYLAELNGEDLSSKRDFMFAIDLAFDLPSSFAHNWESLKELLSDPYWIQDEKIVVRIVNNDQFYGKLRHEALTFFNEIKAHLEDPNTKQEMNYTLEIEMD